MNSDCIFCKIVSGDVPSHRVWEDERCFAFLDIGAVTPGHTLVIPKTHAEDIFSISHDDAGRLMQGTREVARLLNENCNPTA